MLQGYPFWSDAGAPTTPTIFDPILRAAVTTLTFRGSGRGVRIMGVSASGDTPTFLNRLRVKVGNSSPDYKYHEIPTNAFDHDGITPAVHQTNYYDMGGILVNEGEAITLSAVGTGAFSGVLWVEDFEPYSSIPTGDIVMCRHGGTNDGGAALAVTGFDMDARTLVNEYLYTVFMVEVCPEDDSVEILIMAADKDAMTLPPVGRMVYPNAPLQFTGQQYNNGNVIGYFQAAAACKVDIRMWMIESAIPGVTASPSSPSIDPVVSPNIPGAVSATALISPAGNTGSRQLGTTSRGSSSMFRRG